MSTLSPPRRRYVLQRQAPGAPQKVGRPPTLLGFDQRPSAMTLLNKLKAMGHPCKLTFRTAQDGCCALLISNFKQESCNQYQYLRATWDDEKEYDRLEYFVDEASILEWLQHLLVKHESGHQDEVVQILLEKEDVRSQVVWAATPILVRLFSIQKEYNADQDPDLIPR